MSVTDANTNQTSYSYDSRNRPIGRTDGLKVSESYGYDGNSNLTSHIDRRGKVTAFQYDALNRRTFAGFGQSGINYESTINYAWDAGNRITQAADSIAGTITRVPDLLDRLTSETTPQGSISYSYDNANRRQTMQVAGQPQVSYTWDNANRLTGITQGSSSVGINYDNANRRTSLTLPNGVTVAYGVDSDSRITGLTYIAGSSQLGNLSYGYDADGRVTSKGGTLAATNLPNSVTGNTFNADNGMTSFGGTSLSYDANGNLTSDGMNTYTWDARNHLTAISGPASSSFTYDAFERRANKGIAGVSTQFVYDGLNVVQEQNSMTGVANLLTGLRVDEYFTRTDTATSTFLSDAVGSTIGMVGSAGTIATNYTYQPFGASTIGGSGNGNSYEFTGRENDGNGVYFYRARYYSSTFGRFIAQDPIGLSRNIARSTKYLNDRYANPYVYAANDPIAAIDPLGLWTVFFGGQFSYTENGATVSGSIGIVFDDQGNVGVAITVGLGRDELGSNLSGGGLFQWSNAKCIYDLQGPFVDIGGSAGGFSGDYFSGPSNDGPVQGFGVGFGDGLGVSGGTQVTSTIILPLGSI